MQSRFNLSPPSFAEDTEFRKCVGVFLVNKSSEVFLGKSIPINIWQLPQGGVEKTENISTAICRELYEETGICSIEILSYSKKIHKYRIPKKLRKEHIKNYEGQQQVWALVKFLGKNEEINLSRHTPEFSEWKWVKTKELWEYTTDALPEKLKIYKRILREFSPLF